MNTINWSAKTHPSQEELAAFALGKLSGSDAEILREHVENCPECLRIITETPRDTLLDVLKNAKPGTSLTAAYNPASQQLTSTVHDGLAKTKPNDDFLPEELLNQTKYKFIKKLGGGGMGIVYLAEHIMMRRKVAIKLIPPELSDNPEIGARFINEIVSAAKLEHQNVVRAYTADRIGKHLLLEMEYVDGKDLDEVLKKKGPLPVTNAINYIRQAALGLQQATIHGLIHRDIKPKNLMLTRGGQVKIADFGLAKFSQENSQLSRGKSITGDNAVMGTPDYMAPEQARNAKEVDIRADIYSLGCTLYFLLTGRPPYEGANSIEIIFAHMESETPSVRALRPDVSVPLSDYIRKMMAKKPADRPQTPKEVFDKLLDLSKVKVGSEWLAVQPESKPSKGRASKGSKSEFNLNSKDSLPVLAFDGEPTQSYAAPAIEKGSPKTAIVISAIVLGVGLVIGLAFWQFSKGSNVPPVADVTPPPPVTNKPPTKAELEKLKAEEQKKKDAEERAKVAASLEEALVPLNGGLARFKSVSDELADLTKAIEDINALKDRFESAVHALPSRGIDGKGDEKIADARDRVKKLLAYLNARKNFWIMLESVERDWQESPDGTQWPSGLAKLAEAASVYPDIHTQLKKAQADANLSRSVAQWTTIKRDFTIFDKPNWDEGQAEPLRRIDEYFKAAMGAQKPEKLNGIFPAEAISNLLQGKLFEMNAKEYLNQLKNMYEAKPMTDWYYIVGKNKTIYFIEGNPSKIFNDAEKARVKAQLRKFSSESDMVGEPLFLGKNDYTHFDPVRHKNLCEKQLGPEVGKTLPNEWRAMTDKLLAKIWDEPGAVDKAMKGFILRRTLDWVLKAAPELAASDNAVLRAFYETKITSNLNWVVPSNSDYTDAERSAAKFFAEYKKPPELASEIDKMHKRMVQELSKPVPQLAGWMKPGQMPAFQNIGNASPTGELVILDRSQNQVATWIKVGRIDAGKPSWDQDALPAGQLIFVRN